MADPQEQPEDRPAPAPSPPAPGSDSAATPETPPKPPAKKAVKKSPARKAPAKKAVAKAPAKNVAPKKAPPKKVAETPPAPPEPATPAGLADTNGSGQIAAAKEAAAQAKANIETASDTVAKPAPRPVVPAVRSWRPLAIALAVSLLAVLVARYLRRR